MTKHGIDVYDLYAVEQTGLGFVNEFVMRAPMRVIAEWAGARLITSTSQQLAVFVAEGNGAYQWDRGDRRWLIKRPDTWMVALAHIGDDPSTAGLLGNPPKAPDVYEVHFNEEQRALIETGLSRLLEASPAGADDEELSLLRDMIKGMPGVERESPGIIHGLCL